MNLPLQSGTGLCSLPKFRRKHKIILSMSEKPEFMGVKFGLALREEHRLRVLENKCGGRYLCFRGSKREGGWRKLHDDWLHNLYCSQNSVCVNENETHTGMGH